MEVGYEITSISDIGFIGARVVEYFGFYRQYYTVEGCILCNNTPCLILKADKIYGKSVGHDKIILAEYMINNKRFKVIKFKEEML